MLPSVCVRDVPPFWNSFLVLIDCLSTQRNTLLVILFNVILLGKPSPLSTVRLPGDTLPQPRILPLQCFIMPFSYVHATGDYGCPLSCWNSTFLSARTDKKACVMSLTSTATVDPQKSCRLILMLLASTVGKVYSFFRVFCRARREKAHTAEEALTFPPSCSQFPDGVMNARGKTSTGSFVLCLKGSREI